MTPSCLRGLLAENGRVLAMNRKTERLDGQNQGHALRRLNQSPHFAVVCFKKFS
jgi:hypothetical protein